MIHKNYTITLKDNLENSRRQLFSLRKNINRKLDIHSFYQLVRFAHAFDLV